MSDFGLSQLSLNERIATKVPNGDDTIEVDISKSVIGMFVGKGGSNIRRLENETGCQLRVVSRVVITGDPHLASRAEARVQDEINQALTIQKEKDQIRKHFYYKL